jgi:protein-S-isoprenylcysteine O-methyltransferase Ste14
MLIFYCLLILWLAVALGTFVYLFNTVAPYGRHESSGWGLQVSARFGWVVMESPSVILMFILGWVMRDKLNVIHETFLMIWLIHYIHRTFIYPFWMDMTTKTMPITIPISAFIFNIINVLVQAIGIYYFTEYSESWYQSLEFKLGLIVFVTGMFINIYSDFLITRMKKNKGPGYHIPNSFLHKYISSPNYFGEIIEWLGWAILTWSASGLVFFIWTFANLFPRAISNHAWYKDRFEEYPKNRKAIFPGII